MRLKEGERTSMALKPVGQSKTIKLTSLAIGDVVKGYFTGYIEGRIEGTTNLKMLVDDEPVVIFTAGNVRFKADDKEFVLGQYTEIERLADTVRGGKKTTNFRVEQDDERTIEVKEAVVPTPSVGKQSDLNAKIEALRVGRRG